MILGPKTLLKLVKTKKLVENLSERELTNPEGAGFDLRLGEVYTISGDAFLGETERKTADIKLVAKYQNPSKSSRPGEATTSIGSKKKILSLRPPRRDRVETGSRMTKPNTITIKPGDYFLVTTIESVNTPLDLTINFKPRTTTFRSGLFLRTGNVAPGYKGKLTFGLKNEGPITVTIEMGARFVHAQFEQVLGEGNQYRGQWQGGRVAARKREVQV